MAHPFYLDHGLIDFSTPGRERLETLHAELRARIDALGPGHPESERLELLRDCAAVLAERSESMLDELRAVGLAVEDGPTLALRRRT